MKLNQSQIQSFKQFIWNFYQEQARSFAWRNVDDPYLVVVSEIMLQQTQTYRVEPKYENFILAFPNFETLSQATLRDVLSLWQGLGYNRRGMYLHNIAKKVINEFGGIFPSDPIILETFDGIGKNTAGSICAFSFNKPVIFIETNIRAVFIESFFKNQDQITDKQIIPLVEQTLDYQNPRHWYYALMDYGVHLKKMCKNPSRRSAHHTIQTKFEGSDRQIRGMILKALTKQPNIPKNDLVGLIGKDLDRVQKIAEELCDEKLIKLQDDCFSIS